MGRRLALVLLMLASLAAAAPSGAAAEQIPLSANGCPEVWPDPWWTVDQPGRLVPGNGAVSVTLCELVVPRAAQPYRGQDRTLTAGVAEMIAVINALPDRAEMERRLRAQERAKGRTLPDDLHLGQVCNALGYGAELSFAVRYAAAPPAVVFLDRNCGTAQRAGRTRFLDGRPIDAFHALYRIQTGAPPVPSPAPS